MNKKNEVAVEDLSDKGPHFIESDSGDRHHFASIFSEGNKENTPGNENSSSNNPSFRRRYQR